MRTFILRARKGTTRWELVRAQIGTNAHFEVVAHSIINAFFISNNFRTNVEMYIVLDSTEDFPRTIKLSGAEGISIAGFHEAAVLDVIEQALKVGSDLQKDETREVAPGLSISAFGFEKLVTHLLKERTVYLLDPKGDDIHATNIAENPVFILSDHLALPKNIVKSFGRRGLKTLSLGKKMLFASQCVVLLNHAIDIKS